MGCVPYTCVGLWLARIFRHSCLYAQSGRNAASYLCTIVTATEFEEAGVCEWYGSLCPSFAVLPLRQHLPRLRQRKGCGARSAGLSLAKARGRGRPWHCDRAALDAVAIYEHRLPPSLLDECHASCRPMPPLPEWLVHPRRWRQGVHAMPIRRRLLPGKEHRHPRAWALASAAVQVRIKVAAHCG